LFIGVENIPTLLPSIIDFEYLFKFVDHKILPLVLVNATTYVFSVSTNKYLSVII